MEFGKVILLDTHVVFWLALNPDKISTSGAGAIRKLRKAGERPAISCISLYELSRMSEWGRVVLDVPFENFLIRVRSLFEVRPITSEIAMTAARLPNSFPGDPADRLIAATAIIEGLPLVTANHNIRRSRLVKTIW